MKTKLGFLTEEGRTRSKNAFRRFCAYAVLMLLIAGGGGYAIHRYWVSANLTLLQRVYFKQYLKSSWRTSLFNMRSHYTTLVITVVDARTKKERALWVLDNEVVPELDELGRLQYDQRHYPKVLLKGGIEHKRYFWSEDVKLDLDAYNGLRQNIYDDKSLIDVWQPAWLGALIIFIAGTIGLTTLDAVAQRLYLKGEAIRGTRELTPKRYAREHRSESGYGIEVFAEGGQR